jgi:hypothetical protein
VIDAPETLEALLVYGFERFDDPAAREAVGDTLSSIVDPHYAELEAGVRVDDLTAEDLLAAGVDDPGEVSILGAAGLVVYRHPVDAVLGVVTHPHRDEVFEDASAYTVLAEEGDRECFVAGECTEYAFEAQETTDLAMLGTVTHRFHLEMARVTSAEGPDLVLGRTLAPDPVRFSTQLMAVDQQYGLFALWDEADGCTRLEAFWVDARFIGLEVPDYFAVEQAVSSMAAYAEEVDAWLDE